MSNREQSNKILAVIVIGGLGFCCVWPKIVPSGKTPIAFISNVSFSVGRTPVPCFCTI